MALVNNMPDAALAGTEGQLLGLVAGAGVGVEVSRYVLTGVPRGPRAAAWLAGAYRPVAEMWDDRPDAVIVTGAEPMTAELVDEAYWDELAGLLEVAAARPVSLLLSCLSAHAALWVYDGLGRDRLVAKCAGVFAHEVADSALTAGMQRPAVMPHSRSNEVATEAVVGAGWEMLLSSPVGWGAVTARRGEAEVILVQGHPEYSADQLLREYRRDLGRFLRGERPAPPDVPAGVVAPGDLDALIHFHHDLLDTTIPGGAAARFEEFDFVGMGARVGSAWRGMAERFYQNWLAGVAARPTRPA